MSIITKQFKIASWTANYWGVLYIPDNITGKVPLVVFNHGAGETGSTEAATSKLYSNGPLNFIKSGWKPAFMVLALQNPSWSPTATSIDYVLKNDPDILKNWDGKNCLVTGLSAGGESTVLFMDQFDNPTFAYVPMSPAGDATLKNPSRPHRTWFFSGDVDYHFTDTAKSLAALTKGKLTIFKGGHCCWNTFYNPNYKEDGKNIYEWAFSSVTPPNKLPVAMAGGDQSIKLPISEVILSGGGTDEDGTIVSAQWVQIAGPSQSNILSPTGFTTQVTGLQEGEYVLRITVKDNQGLSASDDVTITVSKSDVIIIGKPKLIITDKDGIILERDITDNININI